MNTEDLIGILTDAGVGLAVCVPDSLLKSFCSRLNDADCPLRHLMLDLVMLSAGTTLLRGAIR
ncbi:thiamine pyrophosphate-binding protein [Burkholderia sp. MSMB1552]|nr:thiamine pyrophosphate-binding protein [Burkholderia sp. MSMB1552]KWZ51371.1 thiamine pyrophosphate-binding protein [Burkholderia sp. MSMB1588]